jgi:AcrR family transcriptional regulator
VPRLWDATIDGHRRTMHAAILDSTAALMAQHGVTAVTMSQIAQHAGIGRATLYKYFPDVESIVLAWHERQVSEHLSRLTEVATSTPDPTDRLREVLHTYAKLSTGQHDGEYGTPHTPEVALPLHRADHVHQARQQLHSLITDVLAAAAETGAVRTDIPVAELATYCIHALSAAPTARSHAALTRLITITLAGLTPPTTRRP